MKKTAKHFETKHSRNNVYMHVVKAKTLEAQYKARTLKAKDVISCPRGQGLSSRTTSLKKTPEE
jgi:hypothetical protein